MTSLSTEGPIHGFRLSPQQDRLLALHGAALATPRTRVEARLTPGVDRDRLQRALAQVVARHESLRTRIVRSAGGPAMQTVAPAGDADTDVLVTWQDDGVRLDLPVTCADAVAACVVLDEIARTYAGETFADGDVLQYPDVSEWQWQLLEGEDGAAGRSFWRRQAGFPFIQGSLPLAVRRRAADHTSCEHVQPLEEDVARQLTDASTADIPVTAWCLAALALLLHRLGADLDTSESRIVIGTLADGRKYEELQRVVGLLARVVPVDLTISAADSCASLVSRAAERMQTAYEWQESFVWSDHPDAPPYLPVSFAYLDGPALPGDGPFESIESLASEIEPADLSLTCRPDGDGFKLHWRADARLFTRDALASLGRVYQHVLALILSDPHQRVDALDLVDPLSRRLLLEEFNQSARFVTDARPVHEQFAARAIASPAAIAVEDGLRTWTYGDLHRLANAVAAALRARDLRPEEAVGVCFDHSFELLGAVMGVLAAGGAYLPIDPTTPADRQRLLCRDAAVRFILTHASARVIVADDCGEVLVIDADVPAHATGADTLRESGAEQPLDPDRLAYVIYTSGSTGVPKGVMVPHRGLTNYVRFAIEAYGLQADDRVPLHSSLAFDLTVTSLLAPLTCGARIVIARSRSSSISALAEVLRDDRPFALLKVTPAHARLLATQLGSASVRTLVVGGEALSFSDIASWMRQSPAPRIVNEYGPTETVVGCTVHTVETQDDEGAIPIGRPVANARVYLLDRSLRPVPLGATGELFIGGVGVARGYLGRPELTADRFLPDPFGGEPGARLYRTGDRARYRADGTLEYLGRVDDQIKIRGHRVEPGEIEAALLRHPAVDAAGVVARPAVDNELQLVAYVAAVRSAGETVAASQPTGDELRRFLEGSLPEYMLPASFVFLDRLPLTPNGKLDRRALPEPTPGPDTPHVPPRTMVEEVLAGVWSQVLDRERVGIDDHYFAIGGNSIRSLQVVARARDRGLPLTIDHLFQHPTIRELAEALARLDPPEAHRSSEPFSLLTADDRARVPQGVEDGYPLSRLQAGMIYHRHRRPDSAVYHDVCGYDVEAPFDPDRLRAAVRHVVDRHPMLRTSFDLGRFSEPIQLVHGQIDAELLAIEDLRGLTPDAREHALAEFMMRERQRDFDLDRPPLLRFFLHRLTDETFTFWVSFHHAILDGWSDISMLVELALTYRDLLDGRFTPKAPPATTYAEYVALEREAITSAQMRRFWVDQLQDASPLRLPRWRRRRATSTVSARETVMHPVDVNDDLSDALQATALRLAVPLKSVLLAAHLRFLALMTGESDVLTLLTAVGRSETRDGERALGLHLNSIPVRLRVSGDWPTLIRRAFEAEGNVMPARRFPMVEIQKALGWEHLSDVSFYFTHYYQFHDLAAFPGFRFLRRRIYEETNFPLVVQFSLRPETGRLAVALCYDAEEFCHDEIAAMSGLLARTLERAANVAAPGSRDALDNGASSLRVDVLDALSPDTRRRLIDDWNQTSDERPFEAVVATFDRQATLTPDAMAVDDGGNVTTYGELKQRASALAAVLHMRCLDTDTIVAVLLDHSADLVAAVLGVLEAGAAYLPIEPGTPVERVAFMLRNAQVRAIVTQRELRDRVPPDTEIIDIETVASTDRSVAASDASRAIDPDALAYVIYTSGSTGTPKGVMVTHRGLSNYLTWASEAYEVSRGAGAPLHSSIAFDLTVTSLLAPLLHGRCVTIARRGGISVDELADVLRARREPFSLVKVTPAHARLLGEQLRPDELRDATRALIVGGEALMHTDVRAWREHAPDTRIVNEYGPTETVVGCCVHAIADDEDAEAVPIGRPIANTTLFILDAALEPSPIGVPGELYIGGVGLARGYLGRPDLTATRFLPHPFSGSGERLYRTGDRARYREDGVIEYLGRLDDQVKIRGHRVEPGEIAAALTMLPSVRDAVVVAQPQASGDTRLVAYIVPAGGASAGADADADSLRAQLGRTLPDYMIPTGFVPLPHLPLTSNGKLDRRALPVPIERDARAYEPPRTETEEILAGIWSQVLGIAQVGRDDEYFALGGDSIRSLQVVARARERGLHLSVAHTFDHPTLRDLAAVVTIDHVEDVREPSTPFGLISADDARRLPSDLVDAYPLAQLQAGMLFHRLWHPGSPVYHDVCGYRVQVPFDRACLEQALATLVERHPILRTSFDLAHFSEPLQLVHPRAELPLTVEDLRGQPEDAQERAVDAFLSHEKEHDLPLDRPPLARVALQRLSDDRMVFWITIQHAILDGWSHVSMLVELAGLYRDRLEGRPVATEGPSTLYRDFVARERAAVASDEARAFWSRELEGLEPYRLPREPDSGRAETAGAVAGVATHRVPLTPALAASLADVARRAAVPLKTVLLAAHLRLLGLLTGRRDPATLMVSVGRLPTPDGDRVLGLHLNSLPVRARLQGTWLDLVRAAFDAERRAAPHRHMPLAELQRLYGGERPSDVNFLFTHFHVYEQLRELPALRVIGTTGYEETEFPFVVHFSVPLVSRALTLELIHAQAQFSPAVIARMGDLLLAILERIATDPAARLDAADDVSPSERVLLLAHGTGAPMIASPDEAAVGGRVVSRGREAGAAGTVLLHEQIAAQAHLVPNGLAVVECDLGQEIRRGDAHDGHGGRSFGEPVRWTYAELDRRVGTLARRMRERLVPDEACVAILLPRSADVVTAILATLHAGAAYVPLDPASAEERLIGLVRDTSIAIVITTTRFGALANRLGVPVLFLDREAHEDCDTASIGDGDEGPAVRENTVPQYAIDPARLAYVIHTSGSTGVPRGVMISHESLARSIEARARTYAPPDRFLLLFPFVFDGSVAVLFWTLSQGGTLFIPSDDQMMDPGALADIVVRERISHLFAVPSLYRALLAHVRDAAVHLSSLRAVIVGGEACSAELVELHRALVPEVSLFNEYGPTEATVWSTQCEVTAEPSDTRVPIGRPIPGTRTYVMDDDLRLVPTECPGELYIGGPGVGRGYFGQPAVTAERFLPDPVGDTPGARIYRSGDRVRWRADGRLEHLGRRDGQVKVRGIRLEVGEVEAALAACAGVRGAAVVAAGDEQGGTRLVAYVEPEQAGSDQPLSTGAVQRQLRGRLPRYAQPSAIVVLPHLPRTPGGKIDRRALPPPAIDRDVVLFEAPQPGTQATLAQIVGDVLGVESVGAHDDFFELGGHSLLATQTMSRVRQLLDVDVPVRTLFESPTISELADAIDRLKAVAPASSSLPPPIARLPRPDARTGAGAAS